MRSLYAIGVVMHDVGILIRLCIYTYIMLIWTNFIDKIASPKLH